LGVDPLFAPLPLAVCLVRPGLIFFLFFFADFLHRLRSAEAGEYRGHVFVRLAT